MKLSRWRPHRPDWWSKNATRGLVALVFLLCVFGGVGLSLYGRIGQLEDQRKRDKIEQEFQNRQNADQLRRNAAELAARKAAVVALCKQNEQLANFVTDIFRRSQLPIGRRATNCTVLASTGQWVPIKGKKGEPGATGAQGSTGGTGTPGLAGGIGPPGNPGKSIRGETGSAGATGAEGAAGGTGSTGSTGASGSQGPKGDKGEKGETGDTGPQGPAGPQGPPGPEGPPGPPGPGPLP